LFDDRYRSAVLWLCRIRAVTISLVIKASASKEIDALVADLSSANAIKRDGAIARLSVIGQRAVERLVRLAADSKASPAARLAAFRTLENIADPRALPPALAAFARPGSYNERQVRRFAQLWEINKTREVPQVEKVGARLAESVPDPLPSTVVHGDFRLGNTMVSRDDPTRILAVLDWEMGAIGDPRADVGYLLATYSEPGGAPNPLGTSPITALAGFPSRAKLVERYVARSGREVEQLPWFEALALWKAAVFCEAIYGRFVRGELGVRAEVLGAITLAISSSPSTLSPAA